MSRRLLWACAGLGALLPAAALAAPAPSVSPRDWARFSVLTPAGPDEPAPEVFRRLNRLVWSEHKVGRGETSASALARLYRTTVASLQATNHREFYLGVRPGRSLTVLNQDGMLYEVKKDSETIDRIVRGVMANYSVAEQYRQKYKDWVVRANNLPGYAVLVDYEFEKGDRILLPGVRQNFDTYHYPVAQVTRFSSMFGMRYHPLLHARRMHSGVDIPKPYGTPVYPSRDGKVVEAGWHEGYGLLVTIRHRDGYTTRYGHLSQITVKAGQAVRRDRTLIGKVGSTGISTGPHLHFEMRTPDGKPFNPRVKIGGR